MADPTVINWIKRAAAQTKADPVAMLATSLTEDGARLGVKGDQGTSFGPFQFHTGGALGSHPPAWASTYAAILNRAQEFARLGVHGGKGAAAIQRPADPAGYAQKVQARLAEARQLLGQTAASKPASGAPETPAGTLLAGGRSPSALVAAILAAKDPTAALGQFQAGLGQSIVPSPTGAPAEPSSTGKPGVVTTFSAHPKIIGMPHQGTHNLGNWESDNAIDIALPKGTPIYAAFNGTIGSQIGSLGSSSSRFAGLRVHLAGPGNELYYAHLSKLAVKAGQKVTAGQLIGYSGVANGVAHLHLGSRNGSPMQYA